MMCGDCVKEEYPDRDSVCLNDGAYYQNFAGCVQCSGSDVLQIVNKEKLETNTQETVIYEHSCKSCGHKIATHTFEFEVIDAFQEYSMNCLLCGDATDSRSIMPVDPRLMSSSIY